ncbi:UDP-N-acetylmuramoyl-L-alanyl-D-glutamate--2,6-diaminopimelate ligase [Zavarzinia compransoris]|uniref:UDP-N-acetylmuramoyl-L-alanyl-D-glutamate--2,6-diaminopimelate ligase n=1 Tax=Zavarzinia compransoris TaxID=1264899 RepID=A0A317DYU6_9PROT|nr:UDP-N-acetylmuramoyl-L-alanyl-D-glutamate--2,6-diaminopimelate ligase [Zavarzinia compransoris]PWR18045.1 UDP-N-acetylmuramoyl-L-alanyl-D-glutamate--2,6-diaminopimelate ligase [Zavarzinia compransoris]TDP43487.1 UDP-N-acetylmuramoylalanyl-D-glutamate--2,6-diaminopimelate ligase [Zavarzinia compransoris]
MATKRLADLIPGLDGGAIGAIDIAAVTADSRQAGPGSLFFALAGTKDDGRRYIADALARGAAAIAAAPGAAIEAPVPVIEVADPRLALARAAAAFYGRQPATVVAVTGTNGKTSVANFARQLWAGLGRPAAAIGTLGVTTDEGDQPLGVTTPDPVVLHRVLADLAGRGIDHVAMEASSHGLDQRRLDGVRLAAGAFTNLTRDHLDYHRDFADYLAAKRRLFDALLPPGAPAVINRAGEAGEAMIRAAAAAGLKVVTVGGEGADIALLRRQPTPAGQALRLAVFGAAAAVELPLAGDFQAANALVALGLLVATGVPAADAVAALGRLTGVPGRLELAGVHVSGAPVFVDYAHTPDALARVLGALRPHVHRRLVVVFGCGGDRDPGKRPEMGRIAATGADRVIVTDDNPRSEEPAKIRAQILAASPGAVEIGDRAAAIAAALSDLAAGDVVVVAGKGHEQGQTVKGETRPFDDRTVVRAALRVLKGGAA